VCVLGALACSGCGAGATAGATSGDWHVFASADFGISIRYPADWHVAHDSLTGVEWPPDILAVSSFPLAQPRPDPNCAPVTARSAIPEDGVFIYLFENTGAPSLEEASMQEFPSRPEHFTLDKPVHYDCFGISHRVAFRERDRLFQAMVAFGPETGAEMRETVLEVLDSIEVLQGGAF
jgi:hypothetical protein